MRVDIPAIKDVLDALDIEPTNDNIEHMLTLALAMELYVNRSFVHGQSWRRYGAMNNLVRLATKCERLLSRYWGQSEAAIDSQEADPDDAFDAINYAVFVIRQGTKGEWFRG